MAWPCITRACCMARFWSQLDKADISVPLVFTSYSEACDSLQPRAQPVVAVKAQPSGDGSAQEVSPKGPGAPATAASSESAHGSVMRQDFKAWKVRREPSCKPKREYHEPEVPLATETQYQKDFKPWPLPRRDHPWIPKASRTEQDGGVEKGQIADRVQEKEILKMSQAKKMEDHTDKGPEPKSDTQQLEGRAAADALNRQIKDEVGTGSSYRTEFKAYTDVKPTKLIRARSQYQPPDEKRDLETSYSATYRGEQGKLQADNKAGERRRVRTLYSEPCFEPHKGDRPGVLHSKSKKTASSSSSQGKAVKKSKEKQGASGLGSGRGSKKKSSENQRPSGKEKSKEMNNKLAEAKE